MLHQHLGGDYLRNEKEVMNGVCGRDGHTTSRISREDLTIEYLTLTRMQWMVPVFRPTLTSAAE